MGTTPAKITNAPWTLCKLPWKLNLVPRLRLSVSRRSWNLTSMSSKLHWTTPTRPMLKHTNPSSVTKLNSKAASEKRHLESAIHTMHAEIDDMLRGAKGSEDKAKKAMVDAARLADELRAEQDHCAVQEKAKRALTSQLSELEGRLADANEAAAKGGRNAMAKLESRIREMEIELGSVQSKTSDAYKAFQKAERRIKELQFQQDEDKKNQDSMSELANNLQMKIKTYKKQIEEAEEIAALNLAKYRKAQQELEETEDRNKMAEAQLAVRSF